MITTDRRQFCEGKKECRHLTGAGKQFFFRKSMKKEFMFLYSLFMKFFFLYFMIKS
jgi:hypothetical protein